MKHLSISVSLMMFFGLFITSDVSSQNRALKTPKPSVSSTNQKRYIKISLREFKTSEDFQRIFPDLKYEDSSIETDDISSEDSSTEEYPFYAAIHTLKGKNSLMFTNYTDPAGCGSRGCSFTVDIDTGNGYKTIIDMLGVSEPIYVSEDHASILLCGNPGYIEFSYKNGIFKQVKFTPKQQKLARCR